MKIAPEEIALLASTRAHLRETEMKSEDLRQQTIQLRARSLELHRKSEQLRERFQGNAAPPGTFTFDDSKHLDADSHLQHRLPWAVVS